ncbi:hypothetical protein ACL02U_27900 [Streptomyces sp. MS06]|uniref:hypothetical protein n=1 Tax=Streptomyces sp. MS06 TaxID=3385974 RepID=UPI0039A38B71
MNGPGEADRRSAPSGGAAVEAASAPRGRTPAAGVGTARSEAATGRHITRPEGGTAAGTSADEDAPRGDAAPREPSGRRPPAPRRGGADPVKTLMHRHRELCERAVDPLEIAAGLEAHGVTDRTAARFRHRDVFSLAEEMYARVPRSADTPAPSPSGQAEAPAGPGPRADWAMLALLPGVLCAATVTGLHVTAGQSRLFAAVAGVLAVAAGVRAALARGPLAGPRRTRGGPHPSGRAWTWWLLGYAALGDGMLRAALGGGPDALPDGTADGPWPLAAAPVLALTLSCLPAALSAHLFAAGARRRLAASRGLQEFATAVRPLLPATCALYLASLAGLLAGCAALLGESAGYARGLTLGALLLLARQLTVHGRTHAPAVVLASAATAEAAAVASVFAARLPGCAALGTPVEQLAAAWGAGGVQALVCGTAALTLLVHATRTLTRASAHAPADRSR